MTTPTPPAPPSPPITTPEPVHRRDRTVRYQEMLLPDDYDTPITIHGVGAIGRPLAINLATMGFPHLTIIDPDMVSPENLGPQGYAPTQIGLLKVLSLRDTLNTINDDVSVIWSPERSPDTHLDITPVHFLCVDSMKARLDIVNHIHQKSLGQPLPTIIDCRMSAQNFTIYSLTNNVTRDEYLNNRDITFPDSEADTPPCTMRSTLHCASACAAFAIHRLIKVLQGHTLPHLGITVSMASDEIHKAP